MLIKKYIKSRDVYKVTFEVPTEQLPDDVQPDKVHLVGEFNNWDPYATPMKQNRSHKFRTTVELQPNTTFQFRYQVNGKAWCNDWHADDYIPNGFGQENCVVVTAE